MKIQNYMCLMLLLVYKNKHVLNCTVTDNNEALHENITIQENTKTDFIYHLREETSPTLNDTFFLIEIKLCENEKYQDVCRCRWRTEDNILCINHRNFSMCEADNHVMRFSLLVKRTYSHILWELMRSKSPLVVLRNTKLRVTYLPKVTGLQVNGREVNETVVVEENQEVSVSCSFTNGNPPVTVRLVDERGQTQNSTKHGVGPLVMSVGGFGCQDVWPVITCEAPGSELKRSVAFLVRYRVTTILRMDKYNALRWVMFLLLFSGTAASSIMKCSQRDNHLTYYESSMYAENTYADFSLPLTSVMTQTSGVSDFRMDIKLCENGSLLAHSACRCRWISGQGPFCKNLTNDFICEADNSTMRFSLLVKRTYSDILWIVFRQNATPVVLKHTSLHVTYAPKITAFRVNDQEVNTTHIVGENQEVNVSCFFTNGDPPVNVSLLSDSGKTFTTFNQGSLFLFLGAYHCHDLWPTIRCEATGSELNRSVVILVKCRPQLSYITEQVTDVHNVLTEGLTFAMKSYTRDIRKCLIAQMQPRTSTMEVKCEVSGHAPEFNLTLRSFDKLRIGAGIWTLHVTTESGDSSLTFQLINITGDQQFTHSLIKKHDWLLMRKCPFAALE